MSQRAAEYYTELAAAHDIAADEMPPVLNGMPIPLVEPGVRLPMRVPVGSASETVAGQVRDRYEDILKSLGGFLVACTYEPGLDVTEDPKLRSTANRATSRHIKSVLPHLLKPGWLPTGKRGEIQTQAVDPDELSEAALKQVLGLKAHEQARLAALLTKGVVMLTAANVYPTNAYRPEYVAFVTGARIATGGILACNGRPLSAQELKVQKELWKPRVET